MIKLDYPVATMQPLRQAASEGDFLEVKRLSKMPGVNLNEAGPESGRAALHWAVLIESNEIVSYLLKKKAMVDPLDVQLNTPLNLLFQTPFRSLQKKLAVMDTLLAHGADMTKPNNEGQTPLMNLILLRDALSKNSFFQLKHINAVLARAKESIYKKAQQDGQVVRIYPQGQVSLESIASLEPVSAIENLYVPRPSLQRSPMLRLRS